MSVRRISQLKSYLATLLLTAVALPCTAELRLSGILRSDYRLQGISQSDTKPSVQLSAEYSDSTFFAGSWATQNRLISKWQGDHDAVTEIGYYAGLQQTVENRVSLAAILSRYNYPFDDQFEEYQYNELQLTIDYTQRFAISIGASDRQYNRYDKSTQYTQYLYYRQVNRNAVSRFIELTAQQAITEQLVLSAGAGYIDTDDYFSRSYRYWNIGVGRSFGDISCDLSVIGTDDHAKAVFGKHDAGTALVLGVNIRFL